ncbi:hypothetical protein BOW53_00090 [Solemya pervernicosa gill symbiont]|uniref:GGDEF domain-containing protein n=2 Tax=Gammaproteobacteria incertae sedis TaxID=118884 RepID=A0A1T2LB21_9GAMM|nr:hypothetical protein BOW53_00090 [Solemya pervernicosa gill symbiont]
MLYSLRQIYLGFAALIGLGVVVLVWGAQIYVLNAGESSTANINTRDALLQHSRQIKRTLWEAYAGVDAYLLKPTPQFHQQVTDNLASAKKHTDLLATVPPIHELNPAAIALTISSELSSLQNHANQLLALRTNGEALYPSFKLIRDVLRIENIKFTTTLSTTIDELNASYIHKDGYQLFLRLNHNWTQLTSSFHLYLANRLSGFNEPGLVGQATDVDELYQQLSRTLYQIREFDRTYRIDLINSSTLDDIEESAMNWYRSFEEIKHIHAGNYWRSDIPLLENHFRPLFNNIVKKLHDFDRQIDASAAYDVGALSNVADNIGNTLWAMTMIGLIFIAVVYLFFNRIVLQPIALVAQALTDESRNKVNIQIPRLCTTETQSLVDAFSEMRRQVNSRQTELEHQALHDSLTSLPNRALINDRLEQAVKSTRRSGGSFALIMMDLDRFKEINDTLGHQAGDEVLCQISKRLNKTLRDSDTVARLGGDEFAILLPTADGEQATHIADKITTMMEQPLQIKEHKLYVGGSLGIALFPDHANDSESLLQRADVAMYLAKRSNSGYAFTTQIMMSTAYRVSRL